MASSRYQPIAKYDSTRRAVKARSQLRTAVLGDLTQNIYSDRVGFYFARPVLSADENGNGLLGPTFYLRANPAASIMPKPGCKVKYKKDDDGLYVIVQADWSDLIQQGIDPIALEPNDPYRAFRYLSEIVNLNSYSIGSGLLVDVREWQYHTDNNTIKIYQGTTASTQVDLTAYRPVSVDTQCAALLVFNITQHLLGMNPLQVYTSTPVSIFPTPRLTVSDLQDCYDQLPTDEIIAPIKAYYLQYGQTTIAGISKDLDVRQFINVPNFGVMKAWTVAADSGTPAVIEDGDTLTLHGTGGVVTSITGNTISIDGSGISTLPVVDTTAIVKGSADATKLLRFEVDGFTTATTRVMTPPNYDGTLATLAGIETQTNKTFTSPVINTGVSGTAIDTDATFAANSDTLLASQKATKSYIDQVVLGLSAKADVRLATTAALPALVYANGSSGVGATLTAVSIGVLTIDGVAVALNDRILVKDQVAGLQNGIYKCTVAGAIGVAFILTRTTDGDTDAELRGSWMISTEGTVNAGQGWLNTNTSAITFGTTAITFGEFSAGAITVSAPIVKTGNNLSLDSTVLITTTAQSMSNKTITASTMDSTPIGSTTPSTGSFSNALKIFGSGGVFYAQLVNNNTTNRTVTFPDVSITVVGNGNVATLTNKTLSAPVISGGTMDATVIGSTTPAAGYFDSLRLYILSVAAIFTHAFTADRTVTLPGDANVTLVGVATAQTLTSKTLTTPTIGDLTNATHTHTNAAGGGTLSAAAIASGQIALARGGTNADLSATGGANQVLKQSSSGAAVTVGTLVLADVPNLIAIFRDEKTTGTNGGTSVTTTWNARDLNTELYDPGSIVSISSNQFTPIAGDYEILVFAPFLGGTAAASAGRCRLYNVTGAASVEEGMDTFALTNGPATGILNCKFTANGTDAYRIDTYTSVGKTTNGLGTQVGDGSAEVYTSVMLRKVA